MANGFGSLYIGQSGLQSAQYALNTTANNLANVDTTGYVREQVRFQDQTYFEVKEIGIRRNAQQSGLGVSIADVIHARDSFLDQAYRTENGRQAFYQTCSDATQQMIDLFQETDGQEFKNSLTQLYQAIEELSKYPEDTTNQSLLIQKADLFNTRCQSLYSDLQNYQSNINDQIKDDVQRINEIGAAVHKLNLAIQKVENGGVETAMEYRDQRDRLIDELSTYGAVDVTEDNTGFLYVDFENQRFVDDGKAYVIGLKTDKGTGFVTPYWTQESDPEKNQYTVVFRTDVRIDPDYNNDMGTTKAKLLARGSGYGRYTDIDDTINNEYQYDLLLGGRVIMETEAELDKLFNTIATQMNDLLCPNKTASEGTVIRLVTDKGEPAYDANGKALTYTVTDEDEFAGKNILDVENCAYGSDGELAPYELFSRSGTDRYTKVEVGGGYIYLCNEEDAQSVASLYTIGNVEVNPVLVKDYTKLPTYSENPNENKSQGTDTAAVKFTTAQKMAAVWGETNDKLYITPNDSYACKYTEFYDKVISKLAVDGSVYESKAEAMTDSSAAIESNRQQVTGVSSDEELTKMIKYQAAYNAASRFMTVIAQMTELLVTGLK